MWCVGLMASQLLTGATLSAIKAKTIDRDDEMLYDCFNAANCKKWNADVLEREFLPPPAPAAAQSGLTSILRAAIFGLLQLDPTARWTAAQLVSALGAGLEDQGGAVA
jgi:hypothetical protein